MSTRQHVIDQLDRTVEAHRRAHHHTLRESRAARAALAAEAAGLFAPPETVAEPEPIGMPAGLPPQDATTGLYDLGGPDG